MQVPLPPLPLLHLLQDIIGPQAHLQAESLVIEKVALYLGSVQGKWGKSFCGHSSIWRIKSFLIFAVFQYPFSTLFFLCKFLLLCKINARIKSA